MPFRHWLPILLIITCLILIVVKTGRHWNPLSFDANLQKSVGFLPDKQHLEKRRQEIYAKEAELKMLESEIDDKMEVLQKAEENIIRLLSQNKNNESQNVVDEDGIVIIELDAAQ